MASRLAELIQQDFGAGMMRDVAPQLIDARGVYDLINGLLDDDGSIYRRGGSANKSNAAFGTSLRFLWDGYLRPGRRTVTASPTAFGVLDADDQTPRNVGGSGMASPASPAELRGLLFLPPGYIYGGSRKTAAYSTGTVQFTNGSKTVIGTGTTWLGNVDAGMLIRRGTERVYVVASVDSNTQITLEDAYEGVSGSGITYALSPLLAATAPYEAAAFYTVCANRLVVSDGENRVRFGALDNPHAAFGANDYHELPAGARILGLGTAGATLLVFATNGVFAIDGLERAIVDSAGNPQHRIRQVSRDLVALASAGISSWQTQLIVPCMDSIWLVDGISTPVDIGKPIKSLWRSYVALGHRPGGATVINSHYLMPVLDGSGNWVDTLVCRLDRPIAANIGTTFPWTRLDGAGGQISAFARRAQDVGTPALLGATNPSTARIVDCTAFFAPDATHKADADGTAHALQLVTRDFQVSRFPSVVRKVLARYELLDAGSDNPTLRLDYSSGARLSSGSLWGTLVWGAGNWAAPDSTDWAAAFGIAPEDDGQNPFSWHLNKRLRFARLRLQSSGPAARLTLRELDLFVRPAGKQR